jgi:hypothetical protein
MGMTKHHLCKLLEDVVDVPTGRVEIGASEVLG